MNGGGGSRILWQAAAAAGVFWQGILDFRYMYPFKPARSITIIASRTEYESNDQQVRNYQVAKRLKQDIMTGRRGSEAFWQGALNFRYIYPFELARSISIIVFYTEYGPDDKNCM